MGVANENRNSSPVRFLLIGGWTGVKVATAGSLVGTALVLVPVAMLHLKSGGPLPNQDVFAFFDELVRSYGGLSLVAIAVSAVPAFIGGMCIAWLLRKNLTVLAVGSRREGSLGAVIGALAGLVVVVLVYVTAASLTWHAHIVVQPSSLARSLPLAGLSAMTIVIASAAGAWAQKLLRRELDVA